MLANLIRQIQAKAASSSPKSKDKIKISHYADSATLLLLGDYSVPKAFGMTKLYEKGSGSKLKMKKKTQRYVD